MRRFSGKFAKEAQELNITAFMNLMVILVPFLLITAVFSRISILELNLPPLNAQQSAEEKVELQLQLVVREASFVIQDATLGVIKQLPRSAEQRWDHFTDVMVEIKNRFPDETQITLLLEPSVDYKTLITIMDHVRSGDVVQVTTVETLELFPDISIGDAPPITGDVE